MSETLPPAPEAPRPSGPKRRSLILWFAVSLAVGLAIAFFALRYFMADYVRERRNREHLVFMGGAITNYAAFHGGRLPPTLGTMVIGEMTQAFADFHRYSSKKKGERFDWLYFPKEKLEGLPGDTVLIAAPEPTPGDAGKQYRLVWESGAEACRISEADFQRLIREQNPPAPPAP